MHLHPHPLTPPQIQTVSHILTDNMGLWWGVYACKIFSGIQIKVLNYYYSQWVESAAEWENHQTETSHESAKIFKTFSFQVSSTTTHTRN